MQIRTCLKTSPEDGVLKQVFAVYHGEVFSGQLLVLCKFSALEMLSVCLSTFTQTVCCGGRLVWSVLVRVSQPVMRLGLIRKLGERDQMDGIKDGIVALLVDCVCRCWKGVCVCGGGGETVYLVFNVSFCVN